MGNNSVNHTTTLHKDETKTFRRVLCKSCNLLCSTLYKKLETQKSSFERGTVGWFFKIFFLIGFLFAALPAQAQLSDIVDVGGYFKELGQVSFDNNISTFRYDNSLQNRLETNWTFSDDFEFRADLRTRFISGYSIENTPGITEFYETDSGFADATWVWFDTDRSVLQSQIDRFYASYYSGDFEVHAGRQRINWARTFVWSPNDLFNNYAFLDFDYEERPGVDALLAQYNWSFGSSVQVGYRAADSFKQSVVAGMVRTNWGSYDIQLLGGHYQDQIAVGGGWAGYLKSAGFKGELTYFQPQDNFLDDPGTLTATVGFDYMLPNSLYLRSELLYNGGFEQGRSPLADLNRPPSANDLFIAETGLFLSGDYPVTPLLNASLSMMSSFDRSLFIFIPQLRYSISKDLDLLVLSQLLKGNTFTERLETPNLFFFSLKWSY